jgi:GWxTD domain-containing protein
MRKTVTLFTFIASFLTLTAFQETKFYDFKKVFGLPPFVFQTFQFPASDSGKTQLEVNLGLVNDILQFVKLDDGAYKAGYEIALDLLDSSGTIITGEIAQHHIYVQEFDESNSRQSFNTHNFNFTAPAGKYALHLEIIDLETRKRLERREELEVKDFSANHLQISSIVFLRKLPDSDSLFYDMTETYAENGEDIVIEFILSGLQSGKELTVEYDLKDWDDRVINSWQEKLPAQDNQMMLTRTLTEKIASAGNYALHIKCSQKNTTAQETGTFAVKYQPVIANGDAKHTIYNDPSFALKYICTNEMYKRIIEADSLSRLKIIERFWQDHDPSPGTAVNELRDEFDKRVFFANTHFSIISLKKHGWEVDRGKIYILNGPPTWVGIQSNDFGRPPIEIWYFESLDIRYVFRDKKGDGNYKLIHEE